jgi:hypothetical protein
VQRRVLQHAAAEGVHHADRTGTAQLHQAGHAEVGVGAQLQRVAELAVDTSEHHVDAFEPPERPHRQPAVAGDEVGTLHQRVAEGRGQERVLERRLGEPPGGEHHDAGIVDVRRCQLLERRPQRAEERREAVDVRIPVQRRKHAGSHDAVLERVAEARRHLGAVGQHRPRAVGVAGQISGVGDQLLCAGQTHLVADPQEARVGEHDLGRQHAPPHEAALGVEIREQPVEHLGPLDQTVLDGVPLGARHDRRHGVEQPPLRALSHHRVRDAVGVEQPLGLLRPALQLGPVELLGEHPPQVRPVLPQGRRYVAAVLGRAAGDAHLVEEVAQGLVAGVQPGRCAHPGVPRRSPRIPPTP